nr:PREDICTED: uncharacterized protein LOC107079905 [Lepisosteus oculatus]
MTTRRRSSMNIGVGEEGFGPQGKSMERTPLKSFQNGLCASSSTLTPLFSKLKIKENKKHLNLNSMPSCPVSRIDFSTEAARKASAIESHLQPLGEMGEFKENAEPLRVTEDDRCSLEYRFPDSLPVLPAVGLPQSEAVSTQPLPGRGTAEETYVVDESPVDTVPGVTTGRVRDRDGASQGNVTEHLSGDSPPFPKADSPGEINSTMDAVSLEFLGADVEIWDLPEALDGTTPDSTVGQANGSTFIVQASDPEELQTLNETTHLHGTTVRGEAISAPASRFGSSRAADGHSLDISMKNVSFLSDNPYVDAAHDYCVAPAPVVHKAGGSEIHPAVLCLLERQPDTLENMQSEEDDDASPTALPGVPVALSSPIRNALPMQDQTDQFSSADTKHSPFAEDLCVNAPGTEQAESLMPLGCSPVAPKQSSASLAEGSRVLSVPQSESQEEDSGIGNVLSSEARSLQLATEAEAELPFEADPSASLPRPSLEGSISESFQNVLATPVERAPVLSRSVSLLLKSLVNSSDNQAAGSPAVGTGRGSDGCDPDPRSLSPAADSEHDFFGSGKRKLASPGVGSLNKLWRASPYSPFPQPQLNSTAASLGVKEDWDVSILSGLEEKPEPVSSVKVNDAHPVKASMVDKPDKMGVHAAESLPGGGCSLSRTKAQALQQQLLQMAEILMFPLPSGAQGAPASSSSSVELCPVGTCTTPVHRTERSVNTSGVFERKREISVAEMGTNTDSLLWNLPDPESLQALPRADLEMRLTSALIVMEALSQQVASARARGQVVRPGPSSLRETFVQTDLTELSQVEHDKVEQQYQELYVGAVQRVRSLELPQEELQALLQRLKDVRDEVFSMSTDTAAALTMAQETFDLSKANQDASAKQMSRMKGLHGRSMEMLRKMREKVVESQRQRDGARQQVEEALRAKEAAHAVAEALRCHSAARIRELEQSVGSHQELVAALRLARPEQDALNDGVAESLQSFEELCEAMKSDGLQMREQLTVLTERLREAEQDRALLQRENQELSTRLSSAEAWQTQLSQALSAETER